MTLVEPSNSRAGIGLVFAATIRRTVSWVVFHLGQRSMQRSP
jgi:hypothetical protein